MRHYFYFIIIVFFFTLPLSAQFRLNVQGDAQVAGRLELWPTAQDTTSLVIGKSAAKVADFSAERNNIFIGNAAGVINSTGYSNTFLGGMTGFSNETGFYNTFVGHTAGYSTVGGMRNTFVGSLAGYGNVAGASNAFFGFSAGRFTDSGGFNTFLGAFAGNLNASGNHNTFVGLSTGSKNTSGSFNTFLGADAGRSNKTGHSSVAVGRDALRENIDRSRLVAVGDSTLYHNGAGASIDYHATGNTAIGSKAGFSNTTGWENTFLGVFAGTANETGIYNTFSGAYAGYANQDGIYNTFYGRGAGFSNTTGDYNTFLGVNAGGNNSGGIANTFLGRGAGGINTDGAFITSVGHLATMSGNNLDHATVLGTGAVTNADEKTVIGRNTTGVVIGGYANWSNLSDGRFKEAIEENVPGLPFIRRLRPVTYWVNIEKLQRHITAQMPDTIAARYLPDEATSNKAKQEIRTGFVAQEVEAAAKRIGYEFDGVNAPKNPTDNYSIAYGQFVPSLVKATQEQQEEIETLRKEKEALQARMDELESLVHQLLNQNQHRDAINSQVIELKRDAQLYQNRPNPFGEATTIAYYIPEGINSAQLRITAPDGKVLRMVDIPGRGAGQVMLRAKDMTSGVYAYSLIIDGRILDTHQLVMQP